MSARKMLAWKLLKARVRSLKRFATEPLQRDSAGQLLATLVAIARYVWCIMSGRYGKQTEVERRAVVNARKRLLAKRRAV